MSQADDLGAEALAREIRARASRSEEAVSGSERRPPAEFLPTVYRELRTLAARHLRQRHGPQTLQPTALVHEVYLRFASDQAGEGYRDSGHFFSVAAKAMRQILIDHARKRGAQKRGRGRDRITLSEVAGAAEPVELLDLEAALQRLAAVHERPARVAELRFFAGLGVEQVAEVLAISPRTVKGDWRLARAWLRRELGEEAS